jgi:hypothetical protein
MLTLWASHWLATKPTQASYFCGMDLFSYDTPCCYFELFKIYFVEHLCLRRFWCLASSCDLKCAMFHGSLESSLYCSWTWLIFLFLLILGILTKWESFLWKVCRQLSSWQGVTCLFRCALVELLGFESQQMNRIWSLLFFMCELFWHLLITNY